jgi:hypothetical protein
MRRLTTPAFLLLLLAGVVVAQDDVDYPFRHYNPYAERERDPEPELKRPECDHTSDSRSRFDAMRYLPPVTVRKFTPDGIEWEHRQFTGEHTHTDETTDKPSNFDLAVKGTYWWVLYCIACRHTYSIVRAPEPRLATKKEKSKP